MGAVEKVGSSRRCPTGSTKVDFERSLSLRSPVSHWVRSEGGE